MPDKKHEAIQLIKALQAELGRPPKQSDWMIAGHSRYKYESVFGTWGKFTSAAGLAPSKEDAVLEKKGLKQLRDYKTLCTRREQIQGFFRSTLDLSEMFARAGNPPSLKLSAQPDTHAKFADPAALNCYIKFIKYWAPDVHLIMGDFVDCEGLSHWPADDLEPRRIVPEMKIAREILSRICEATPSCSSRIYLEGNHEKWISQAFSRMPELFDGLAELDIEISLKTLLGLPKLGYELFPLNELVQIGRAHFTHGIYTGTGHAKKHLDMFKASIYYGHLHDGQEYNQTSLEGYMEAVSLYCLCRLDAKFLKGKPNNWGHGSGCFEFFPSGEYTFYKPRIVNGLMAYNGKVFDGNV